jgi:hypothetical protein
LNNHNTNIRIKDGKKEIFDPIRHRFVLCTPEEVVRQTYIQYLLSILQIPPIAISVERKITYNKLSRRYDIVVFSKGICLLIVECKAPSVELSEATLQQIGVYNSNLQAKYIVLFNGKQELIYQKTDNHYTLLERLPGYEEM